MKRATLQLRLMSLMAGTIALLVVPAFMGWLHIEHAQNDARIQTLSTLVAESLARELEYPISVGGWDAVGDTIDLRRRPTEIAYLVVDVSQGPRVVRVREGLESCASAESAACASRIHALSRPVLSIDGGDGGLFAESGDASTSTIGTVRVGVDLEPSRAAVSRHTRQMALGVLLASLAVFAAAGGLARRLGGELARQNAMLAEATERAVEASRLKSEFLANMSHEIRTPMNGVLGMAAVLAARPLDDGARDMVDTIRSSASTLLSILNDTLDLSKIEAGRLDLERVEITPEGIVDDVLELLAEPAHAKGVDLISVIEGPLPARMLGDPTRLRQVLTNLVSNAIKFTTRGTVAVHLSTRDDRFRVEVHDTGVGVSAEAQRYIFDAFRQADGSTTRRFGGTGLGLAIARQMVELMGGRIGVDSVAGQSSTFWFELPFDGCTESPVPLDVGAVLVVSDRAAARDALLRRLDTLGVAALDAVATVDGARVALARGYAIVMIDVVEGQQRELVEAARAAGARPVIVVPRGRGSDVEGVQTLVRPWRVERVRACLIDVHAGARRSIAAAPAASTPRPTRIHTVLVVDDNAVNLKVASHMLSRCHCDVTTCSSGEQALELLERGSFDIVLMDCQMPGLDGYDTTRALRRREQITGRRVPVVAATAHAMRGDRERCLEAGMDDYVTKPLLLEDLQRVVAVWGDASEVQRLAS